LTLSYWLNHYGALEVNSKINKKPQLVTSLSPFGFLIAVDFSW